VRRGGAAKQQHSDSHNKKAVKPKALQERKQYRIYLKIRFNNSFFLRIAIKPFFEQKLM